ncbi:MAG: hypothetical protein FWF81_14710 [Defluviitaleaceae bacterium]|nr:hypothetical protein [Defluviitaleaceae bacterium]
MASSVSLEYLQSKQGVASGLATLDSTGAVPLSQLPSSVMGLFQGTFADDTALEAAVPTALIADFAFVTSTNSFWYWNAGLTGTDTPSAPAWVNQEISDTDYLALSATAQAMVPYIITP